MQKTQLWRRLILTSMVVLAAWLGLRHQLVGGGPKGAAPLDSFCPFGAVETAATLAVSGTFIEKTNWSNLILFGGLVLSAFLAGSFFCGWLCPLGALQDFFAWASKKIFRRQLELGRNLDHIFSYGRYLMLVIIVVATYYANELVFESYDPYKAFFHFKFEDYIPVLVIGLFIAGSMAISRFWCRYLCPLGGLVGLFNKLGSLRPGRKAETCISCHRCDRVCPTAVKITEREKITDSSCVSCLKCVDACPVPETLTIKSKGLFLVLGLLAFFLPPLITQVTGIWQSTPVAAEIEQINDPAQIKGWMTLEDVARAFGLDKNQLARELGLSEAETGEHLKEVMAEKGKDMDYLRAYIAEKLKEK
ncbi:4Fe-4S binding protein [Carboxydocella sp. ULO1]|uniref:4Fe-4S binding protein n=1 Tax=Carboxydocella sp. ULO1 TaxID=1926599 RepID=UPI0009AC2BB8|nr:4Fe-4S binding protein [Carboxydocella sp. ULO1]GAW28379.1 hypothetical protein ULO1_09490 [Carboxydocella sp. ULO1]